MAIIIKLQGLPLDATSFDVRLYFEGLAIPDGGVHIVGGDDGTVFVEFANDEDARQAMARSGRKIKNAEMKPLLSSNAEMISMVDAARKQKRLYQEQITNAQNNQNQQQLNSNHFQQQQSHLLHQQQSQQLHLSQLPRPQASSQPQQLQPQNQQNLNQNLFSSYLTHGLAPMGSALLDHQQQQQQQTVPVTFEGDPRMLSQNYQGMLNVANQQRPHSPKNMPVTLASQPSDQQPTQQPSSFIDPRILSQNYQGIMCALNQNHQQTLLPQQAQTIFTQFPPTTIATSNGTLGLTTFGNMGLGGADFGNLNGVVLNAAVAAANGLGNMLNDGLNDQAGLLGNTSNRSRSPDRARMSGMRGGDDKLFANKKCVLAACNIPYRATSKDIIEFFSEFNISEDCIRRRYNQKGQPTADAKLAFQSPEAAMKAMKMMNKKNLCGRPVFLKPV